jgi:hypothetical protein
MTTTEQLQEKYPSYIISKLRDRFGDNENDVRIDNEILSLSRNEVFDEVLEWEGIIAYTEMNKDLISDIYGIGLNELN